MSVENSKSGYRSFVETSETSSPESAGRKAVADSAAACRRCDSSNNSRRDFFFLPGALDPGVGLLGFELPDFDLVGLGLAEFGFFDFLGFDFGSGVVD